MGGLVAMIAMALLLEFSMFCLGEMVSALMRLEVRGSIRAW